MNELAKAAHMEEHEELSDEALSQVEQDKLEDDIASLDVGDGNTAPSLVNRCTCTNIMTPVHLMTSTRYTCRTLSHVGHYVSLDSWLASLTITFLI